MERRPGYYTAKISLTVSAFAGVWAAVVLVGASWWSLASAAVMAVAYTQIAFIGHDAGHKQIFRGHRVNYLFGVALGNLATGLSYGWWIDKHNRHHANPNHEGKDPDIAPGVLVFTSSQAAPRNRLGVYMGCSFAPNHKGMPVLSPDEQVDYLRRQALTSRNIRGGRIVDFVLGGLNYQIEHHLFPSMPRPSLRRSQPLIRRFCTEHGVTYTRTGLIDSYRQVLRHLDEVGRPLQPLSAQ